MKTQYHFLCKTLLFFLAIFFHPQLSEAQTDCGGCTDATACNFNPAATLDDGTCVFQDCEFYAANDIICIDEGENLLYNVLCNDGTTFEVIVEQISENECFTITQTGRIIQNPNATDCCGEHILSYRICKFDDCREARVTITVKCNKPDCSLINLEDFADPIDPAGDGQQAPCASICQNSPTTFYVPYDANNTYIWSISAGGTGTTGTNDAEFIASWSSFGSGFVNLEIIDGAGNSTFINLCLDILEGPVADFSSDGYTCLDAPICFSNLSSNDDAWSWDFGDGNFSSEENPCHAYDTPGIYTVVLTVTSFNFDDNGDPLCCCTATKMMDVEVDPLPGPQIYWISTLCEGDTSKYWTDATNCSDYEWDVTDAMGNSVPFTSNAQNDTICVVWSTGSFGTISLSVTDCDQTFCDNPTTVTVPIISSVGSITGETIVCENTSSTYNLPKWVGTYYDWQVTGGTLVSENGEHSVVINWGAAGTGTIHVEYQNDFLNGLPNHSGDECSGVADLTVSIVPSFSLLNTGPSTVCVGQSSTILALSSPNPNSVWTIDPSVPFTGQNTSSINVDWDTPGTYEITATPIDAAAYCNTSATLLITVVETPPLAGIDGETEVCRGDTQYYTVLGGLPGASYSWTATDGTLLTTFGSTVGVTWDNVVSPNYSLTVTQQLTSQPFCTSDPFTLNVNLKEINGPISLSLGSSCANQMATYSISPLLQHPDATATWTISPNAAGSILDQGELTTNVQWNNWNTLANIKVEVELCGQIEAVDVDVMVHEAIVPEIVQTGVLCPGVSATLSTTVPFASYSWSTGDSSPTTAISSDGNYTVTTIDANGCEATGSFTANEVPGPDAHITSGDDPTICLSSPHSVQLITPFNSDWQYEWFCNGVLQGSTISVFDHLFQGVAGTYNYQVRVSNTITGCESLSLIFQVTEGDCPDPDCTPEAYDFNIILAQTQFPNCNTADFQASLTNASLTSWNFGDGTSSGTNPATNVYLEAGCYHVVATALVPEVGTANFCEVRRDTNVCVPVAADFDFEYLGCTEVQFTELASYIATDPDNVINLYNWNFGGLGTSSSPDPTFNFTTPGTHVVTLTVTTVGGCTAQISQNVFIDSVGIPVINIPAGPYCVDQAIDLSASAFGATSYEWDFGDLATFIGQNPSHTYTSPNPYTITVTAFNDEGCSATSSINIIVNSGIPAEEITGNLAICAGATTTLTAPLGYTYLWSNGSINQTITVGAGTYNVTLSNAFGCELQLADVTVTELPAPEITITGNLVICDAGCTTLFANTAAGSTFQWLDQSGNPLLGQNGSSIVVCSGSLLGGYSVQVTDPNGCIATSDVVNVGVRPSPSFVIQVTPNGCEGTLNTLEVVPVEPDVTYSWSTGESGPVIMTSQVGTYTCLGVNDDTGCSSSATAVINPQPDLCSVPQGCYEVCSPDTICAPEGLTTYQWNLNGSAIPGENAPCLIVDQSGTYTITATNDFGCEDTSEALILEVIDCSEDDCDDLSVDFNYVIENNVIDSCCYIINYEHNYSQDIYGLSIFTSDAEFEIDLASINAGLNYQGSTINSVDLTSATLGGPIPTGNVNDVITICNSNVTNSPQLIYIDWFDENGNVVCQDSLTTECPIQVDCVYLESDTIYCENGEIRYDFVLCNPYGAAFDIGYFTLENITPLGLSVSPAAFDITGSPITPGTCQTFTLIINDPTASGDTFCFEIIAHDFDPAVVPEALCCSAEETYCSEIPFCDPCLFTGVHSTDATNEDNCCYEVQLFNNFSPTYFDEISFNVISPQTTVTVNNTIASGWLTSGYTPTSFSLIPTAALGNYAPSGIFTLPEICLDTEVAPNQQIEINWMSMGDVVCTDTISLFCEPDCGYHFDEVVECSDTGWTYETYIQNTSIWTVEEIYITFDDPALSAYNQVIPVGSLAPGSSFGPVIINIGAPAIANDEICFTTSFHHTNADGEAIDCCNFKHCITLPVCECICSHEFLQMVGLGFQYQPTGTPLEYIFSMTAGDYFQGCDRMRWNFGDNTPLVQTSGNQTVTHQYATSGSYNVCVTVLRVDDNGKVCVKKICAVITINVDALADAVIVYPNPNNGVFQISISESLVDEIDITILDHTQRELILPSLANKSTTLDIDASDLAKGVYFVRIRKGDEIAIKKVVIF